MERRWLVVGVSVVSLLLGCGGDSSVTISTDGGEGGTRKDGSSHDASGDAKTHPLSDGAGTKDARATDAATDGGSCGGGGMACAVATDCCTGACVNGACSAAQCVSIGAACPTSDNACCTDTCAAGKCAPIGSGGTCTTAGNACSTSMECCSGLCSNGTCNIASSYCTQTNDICFDATSCCGGVCTSPNASPVSATNPGTCAVPPGGSCDVDGVLCDPANVGCPGGCCSDLCAPYGATGVPICQQAQGCHVQGDLCRKDTDCCGGESPDSGILGAGKVTCTIAAGSSIGYCSMPGTGGNGGVCVPEGDTCHYTAGTGDGGYACPSSSTRADCCGPQTPKFLACMLDKLGVPRCLAYGLTDGGVSGCREPASTCATAADCCNGNPCVPNTTGQLECAATACIPTAGACTSTADCCAGITCVIAPGAAAGTCTPVAPPSGGSPDGGSGSDAGHEIDGGHAADSGGGLGCAEIGQSCASLGCCAGLECVAESCEIVLK
jgi:hypothetical protein